MAFTQYLETVSLPASGDLSAAQFKLGQINSSGQVAAISGSGVRVDGVIANKPTAAGQPTELQVGGLVKCLAGAAINPGVEVMSNASALAITATATNYVFGVYVGSAACASGDMIPVLVDKYKI
jgi:hypothetical protein